MSKLKELRERNNISKVDMCKMLCMSENSYSKKEYNVGDMKFKDVIKICNFFNCNIEDIYDYDENNESSKLKSLYICKNKIEFKSYIYFLKDINRGIIKIGKTSHLYFRISQIRSSMITAGINVEGLKLIGIYPTISQDVDLVEKEFHFRFKDKRVLGEWFKINEADIELKKITKVLGVSIFIGETNSEIDEGRSWRKDIEECYDIKDLFTLEELKSKMLNIDNIKEEVSRIINLI